MKNYFLHEGQVKARLEWADALESGQYNQTQSCLMRTDPNGSSFCCLGVAQDLFGELITRETRTITDDSHVAYCDGAEPSLFVQEILGLTTSEMSFLMIENDNNNASFKHIADYIRNDDPLLQKRNDDHK